MVAALALVGSGCGGSPSGTADPPSTPPGSPSATSGSPSPTAPSAPAATGPKVGLARFTARAPAGWRLDHSFGKEIVFASDRHFVNELSYSDTSIYPGTSLGRAERIVARNDDWTGSPRIGGNVTIDGTPFFHLLGPAGQGRWYEVYGHPVGGRLVQLGFKTAVPRLERERLVASVLASVRLR